MKSNKQNEEEAVFSKIEVVVKKLLIAWDELEVEKKINLFKRVKEELYDTFVSVEHTSKRVLSLSKNNDTKYYKRIKVINSDLINLIEKLNSLEKESEKVANNLMQSIVSGRFFDDVFKEITSVNLSLDKANPKDIIPSDYNFEFYKERLESLRNLVVSTPDGLKNSTASRRGIEALGELEKLVKRLSSYS